MTVLKLTSSKKSCDNDSFFGIVWKIIFMQSFKARQGFIQALTDFHLAEVKIKLKIEFWNSIL